MWDGIRSAEELYGELVGEPVEVTFSDGGREAGWLAVCGWDLIEVDHIDITGGGHTWTATYTLTGDDDTPHVVSVAPVPVQTEALFA